MEPNKEHAFSPLSPRAPHNPREGSQSEPGGVCWRPGGACGTHSSTNTRCSATGTVQLLFRQCSGQFSVAAVKRLDSLALPQRNSWTMWQCSCQRRSAEQGRACKQSDAPLVWRIEGQGWQCRGRREKKDEDGRRDCGEKRRQSSSSGNNGGASFASSSSDTQATGRAKGKYSSRSSDTDVAGWSSAGKCEGSGQAGSRVASMRARAQVVAASAMAV